MPILLHCAVPTPSRAELYFRDLINISNLFEHLSGFVGFTPPVIETEYLDFKSGFAPDLNDKKKKAIWSEALSGFGNTEGGVIVWGLEARKDPTTGVDSVTAPSLCPDVAVFEQLLLQSLREACDPQILGVQIVPVPGPDGKAGFVVCYVPEGTIKPHRAELAHKGIYLRAGDSFFIPSLSIVRSLFYSKQQPFLAPSLRFTNDGEGVFLDFFFENKGTATADLVYAQLYHPRDFTYSNIQTPKQVKFEAAGKMVRINLLEPIHPGVEAHFLRLRFDDRKALTQRNDDRLTQLSLSAYSRDTEARYWKIPFSHYDVIGQVRKPFDQSEIS